jgi:hypothetical protein
VSEPPKLDYASPRDSGPSKNDRIDVFVAIGLAIYLILALVCLALVIFIPFDDRTLPLIFGVASVLFFLQAIRLIGRICGK